MTRYSLVRALSQVVTTLPAKVIHAAMGESLSATESSCNLQLAI